jgi:hypothetical protein
LKRRAEVPATVPLSKLLDRNEVDFDSFPDVIAELRRWALSTEHMSTEGMNPDGQEYFLLALGALEQAQRFATLALYKVRQARG